MGATCNKERAQHTARDRDSGQQNAAILYIIIIIFEVSFKSTIP